MKKRILIACILASCFLIASKSQASWLSYHKPEYKGKIIDAETKEPIEGVVVSFYYMTNTYNLGGGSTRVIHTKEILTDAKGEFVIPSYTTVISPFTTSDAAECIIYKPGYASYPNGVHFCGYGPELYFSNEKAGLQAECKNFGNFKPYTYVYGLVELPKVKTRQERLRAMPSTPLVTGSKEFPLLYKLINEEHKSLGLREVR
jgi:hypothetical protein